MYVFVKELIAAVAALFSECNFLMATQVRPLLRWLIGRLISWSVGRSVGHNFLEVTYTSMLLSERFLKYRMLFGSFGQTDWSIGKFSFVKTNDRPLSEIAMSGAHTQGVALRIRR